MEKKMKRFTGVLMVTLTLMGLLLWFALPSLGQTQEASTIINPPGLNQETFKTKLLIAINKAGLSLEQLKVMQGLVKETIEVRDDLRKKHQELNEFLINWDGEPEVFEEALEAEIVGLKEAREALQTQLKEDIKTIKNTLTVAQYETLRNVMSVRAFPHFKGKQPPISQKKRPLSDIQKLELEKRFQKHLSQFKAQLAQFIAKNKQLHLIRFLNHLDLVEEVLTGKIEALQD